MKALILALVLIGSNSFAAEFFAPAQPGKPQAKPFAAGQCGDFSGTWIGVCRDASGEKPSTVVVAQTDCSAIYLNGIYYSVGGTHNVQDIIPTEGGDYIASSATSLGFSQDGQTLNSIVYYSLTQSNKVLAANTYYGASTLKDGKLYTAVKGGGVDVACEYQK
jgi:hypothetical protein